MLVLAHSFSIDPKRLPGIWKLSDHNSQVLYTCSEIVLSADGTFRSGSNYVSGQWKLQDQTLMLALHRRKGQRRDTVLKGELVTGTDDGATPSLAVKGKVLAGRYMYSQNHPAFLEQEKPLVATQCTSSFTLRQVVSSNQFMIASTQKEVSTKTETRLRSIDTMIGMMERESIFE